MKPSPQINRLMLLILPALAFCPGKVSAEIVGDILRVGYPIASESGSAVRHGAWTPVLVDLRLQGQSSFDGELRLRQYDRDGDVYVDSVPVHLFADGGEQQRYWMYTVANKPTSKNQNFYVELFATEDEDDPGKLVKVISGPSLVSAMQPPVEPEFVNDDQFLILDVSDRTMGRIRDLRSTDNFGMFDREIRIAHLSPAGLPNKWFGLDAIDCVVWDDADTTTITEQQEQALVEWVKHGGTLVLAAARTSSTLAQSTHIGPLLPARVGENLTTAHLPKVRSELMKLRNNDADYPQAFTVTRCEPISDPTVTTMLTEKSLGGVILAKRRVDRGTVVFLPAAIHDLLGDSSIRPTEFFKRVLELRRNPISSEVGADYVDLFRDLDRVVGFHGVSGARLAVAILFCMLYVLVATFGVWRLLHTRKMLKHSWTALALVGGGASVLSIVGVQSVHGIGRSLHQLSIVDGTANSVQAHGTAYFGLTASTKNILDVWLPEDLLLSDEPGPSSCVLQPMLTSSQLGLEDASFTDPARYRIKPATAEIRDILLRATLKQLEGRWHGSLPGSIIASVKSTEREMLTDDETGSFDSETIITDGSWIENNLGVDLEKCYLIFAPRDLYEPQKFFDLVQQRGEIDELRTIPLGKLADGERLNLFSHIYKNDFGELLSQEKRKGRSLQSTQTRWGRLPAASVETNRFGQESAKQRFDLNRYENAVLLSTVVSDIDPTSFRKGSISGYPIFSRNRCRQLDMSHLLSSRSAIFIGFAKDAGPIRLATRSGSGSYETIEPKRAWTVFRIVVPVEVQ
ncbi:MAG: hypothetical protein DHS20C16_23720 [Phycisphaerae bacterium]|nr:MAG: hypothetical protein DHS20C16_23720 [Phycisphaerae bacterium]